MNRSLSLLALLAALAAGSASAAGTVAGTAITNTATATFTDPNGNPLLDANGVAYGTSANPATSNTVTTTVQEVPGFSVLLNGQDSSGTPGGTSFTPAGTATARPGDVVSFRYTLSNTGNVADTYTLSPQLVFGTPAPTNIAYYAASADTNTDGVLSATEVAAATPISSVANVPADDPNIPGNDGSVQLFFAAYTVPSTVTDGQTLGTGPVVAGAKATTPDSNNYNQTVVSRNDSGLIGPRDDSNADGTVDNTATAVTPYASPEGRQITYSGDSQWATAPYSTAAQTITFTQTVKNTGNRDDVFDITLPTPAQLDAAGFPLGTAAEILGLTDSDGDGRLDTGTLTPNGLGAFRSFQIRVTLPAGAVPDMPGTIPSVTVTATSSNDTTFTNTTVDNVNLPGVQFGEATAAPGTTPAPAVEKSGQPGAPVSFPMDVYNAGNLTDSFALAGSVQVPLTDGTVSTVKVKYFLADAGGLPTGSEITSTGPLAPGAEAKLVAVVELPRNAASSAAALTITQSATSAATGAVASDTNDGVKVGTTGALNLKKFVDNCGKTNACPAAPLFPATPVNNGAVPQDVLRYTVIAKNNTNNFVHILSMRDSVPTNTTFVSVVGSSTASGTIYYRVNGGAWSTSAPASLAADQGIEVAVDTDRSGTIDSRDTLPVGGELRMDFRVRVN